MKTKRHYLILSALPALLLAGCAGAPAYQRPVVEIPQHWQTEAPWRNATPGDGEAKGAWWHIFNDAVLDDLQQRARVSNQNLQAARARLMQARSLAQASGATLFPRVDALTRSGRQQPSENRATYSNNLASSIPQSDHALGLTVGYELDLFGRVASDIAAGTAAAEQSQADLENTLLILSADLAGLYYNLRATDAEIDVVRQGIASQEHAIDLLDARHSGGAASGLDLAQQQALLDATRTQLELLRRQRLQYEHALATLVGTPASLFSFAVQPLGTDNVAPALPLAIPSELLERRPDIAAAERAVAVANAQIGVTRAAAFPSVALGLSAGFESRTINTLFNAPSTLWSFGTSLAYSLLDGGRNKALVQASRAAHDATVANYRQTVLRAFQEVEDGLSNLQTLAQAGTHAQAAVLSSKRVLDIATYRYEGGATTYLDVVTAQQNVLNNQRLATQLLGQQLTATAFLAKALGGNFPSSNTMTISKN
ncbi:MAG: efflux transporter outer membrane subunit [Burkholderiaceae bacterium]